MTVIPLLRPARPAGAALSIPLRRDLRTNLIAAGLVATGGETTAEIVRDLAAAKRAWTAAGQAGPLALAPPPRFYADAEGAAELTGAMLVMGLDPHGVDIETEETDLVAAGLAGVERLRARGCGVALRLAQDCPLPLGQRERGLFTEFQLAAPTRIDPFLGCDGWQDFPLGRRLYAAHAACIPVTARGVADKVWARALIAAGFDRGDGAFAGAL